MSRRLKLLLGLCFAALLTACGEEPEPRVEGYLYFGAGPYLGVFHLDNGEAHPVTTFGNLSIDHISALDGDEFLLSVSSEQQLRSRRRILRHDPARGRTIEYLLGHGADFLPGLRAVLYEEGRVLQFHPLQDAEGGVRAIHTRTGLERLFRLILPDETLLLAIERDGVQAIEHIDLASGDRQYLEGLSRQCELRSAVWMAEAGRLFCRPPGADDAVFRQVALDGSSQAVPDPPDGPGFRAVAWIAELGVVILVESWEPRMERGIRHAVWAYDPATGAKRRLAGNQDLGDSVIYRRFRY